MIGIHGNPDPADKIVALCKSHGAEFPIVRGHQYSRKQVPGIPRAFVFDHTGKEIYDGSPSGAEEAAAKALKSAPALWLGGATFEKLKPLAAQVERKDKLGAAATSLRAKLEAPETDEVMKAEAQALLQIIEGYASGAKASAADLREQDCDRYLSRLDVLAKELSGDVLGAGFKTLKDKESADPEFQKLRKGLKELAEQAKVLETLPSCKACKARSQRTLSLSCEACKQANAEAITSLKKALAKLAEKYAGTAAGTKASEMASTL